MIAKVELMKKVEMFYLKNCPYCIKAMRFLDELKQADERYTNINITMIEESEQKELANSRDYYYVPTFYVDGKKIFEGAPKVSDIQNVLDTALKIISVER